MRKWVLGIYAGSILIGLILIFSGQTLFPEFSVSLRVAWMIVAGALAGMLCGFFTDERNSLSAGLISGALFGVILFALLGVIFQLSILNTSLTGLILGTLSGLIIQYFGLNSSEISNNSFNS
jgi:hypothetical protein